MRSMKHLKHIGKLVALSLTVAACYQVFLAIGSNPPAQSKTPFTDSQLYGAAKAADRGGRYCEKNCASIVGSIVQSIIKPEAQSV